MVEITVSAQIQQMQTGYGLAPGKMEAAKWARKLFEKSYKEARWSGIRSWFRAGTRSLLYLHPTSLVQIKGRARLQHVPLAQIKGSCSGRLHDFDGRFRPCRRHSLERWLSVAMAFYMHKKLPPVELVKVDDIYFVLDGHHRLSVAEAIGLDEIEANVTEWNVARVS